MRKTRKKRPKNRQKNNGRAIGRAIGRAKVSFAPPIITPVSPFLGCGTAILGVEHTLRDAQKGLINTPVGHLTD